jgi:hypothetical protein
MDNYIAYQKFQKNKKNLKTFMVAMDFDHLKNEKKRINYASFVTW